MKVVERSGDLFDAPQLTIGHGVNTQGVMGAGVAAEFARRYPDMYNQYRKICFNEDNWFSPGMCTTHWVSNGNRFVANLATQDLPGPHARYSWVTAAMVSAANAIGWNGEIAIPRIGCGIGGLQWPIVKQSFIDAGWDNFTVVVYSLE